jgi:iron complex outermembrane receptor protein
MQINLIKKFFIGSVVLAFVALAGATAANEQDRIPEYRVETIVVTATRVPKAFSDIARCVTVVEETEIRQSLARSVQGLLEHSAGIDSRQRGLFGVQGDFSIRGGTFGQTLILVDGAKIMDPQTNHHNSNLPLSLPDIERVEILKGPGSRLYGPNAYGGVINVITKKSKERGVRLQVSGGEHGFYDGTVSLAYPLGESSHRLSFSKRKSDGYRANTDFDIWSVFYGSSIPAGAGSITLSAGHIDNEFGANSFYVDPSKSDREWEHVQTTMLNVGSAFEKSSIKMTPKVCLRRNEDHYVFNRENPSLYENFHTTWSINGENSLQWMTKLGMTSAGMEAGWEKMSSSRLDTLSRWKGGFFLEQHLAPRKNLLLVLGGFAYRYSDWGWQLWPGADAGVQLSRSFKLFGSVNRSFRVPTYTELYYLSPSNQGDPELQPEEGWVYEVGANWSRQRFTSNIAVFRRDGDHIIDWVRQAGSTDLWRARMIGDVNMNGIEFDFNASFDDFPISSIYGSYTFLDTDRDLGSLESAYALANLKHQFQLSIYHWWMNPLKQSWKLRYEERNGDEGHFLVDTHMRLELENLAVFAEASNLLDEHYTDIKSLPLPGRWVRFGFDIGFTRD